MSTERRERRQIRRRRDAARAGSEPGSSATSMGSDDRFDMAGGESL